MYLIFLLMLIAGLAEGVGILMLLPLLQNFDVGSSSSGSLPSEQTELSGITLFVHDILAVLNLPGSTVALLLIITVAFLLKGGLTFCALGYSAYLRGQLLRELKGRLLDAYSRMSYGYYATRDTGYFINLINEQTTRALQSFYHLTLLGAQIIYAIIYLALAYVVAWRFGLMATFVGLVILALFRWLNVRVRALSRMTAQENGNLAKLLIQILQAFKYLTATSQTPHLRKSVASSINRLTEYQIRTSIAAAFTKSANEPIAVVLVMLVVMIQIVYLEQPLAPILVSILLFHRGIQAVLALQGTWQSTLEFIGSIELVHTEFAQQKKNQEKTGSYHLPTLRYGIRLENIFFRYDPQSDDVIEGLNLEIPVRTSVALIGQSGAGKSTVGDLITLMLKPQKGQIVIDGVPGQDVDLTSWRNQIGYVSQETVVFDDSIANNICLWRGDPSRDPKLMKRVREAAQRAHLDYYIETLADGYQTLVGDRGLRLSGGQRQRLFIARELFRKPNLLILDEATSALDSESERAIQQSIDELKGKITVIIIAHRLSTIRNVDIVCVLDNGRLVEQGGYQALRDADDTRFAKLVAMQTL